MPHSQKESLSHKKIEPATTQKEKYFETMLCQIKNTYDAKCSVCDHIKYYHRLLYKYIRSIFRNTPYCKYIHFVYATIFHH